MGKLQHFQRNKLRYEIFCLCCYFFINATILATSVIMEKQRNNNALPFELWEPFVWEYSSAISTLLLFPLLILLLNKVPLAWQSIKKLSLIYLLASIAYCACHVFIMVQLRKAIYLMQHRQYDFGDLGFEMLYEYRKDAWAFVVFISVIHAYRFILRRLQGEANPIQEGEDAANNSNIPSIERFIVKKLGKEFIIKVEDVEWMESSGNYVNLYINERVYPLRATLTKLSEQLTNKGFCRIHRSFAVRVDAIKSITPLSSGDSEIQMTSGKILPLSRRYKEHFKCQLS